MGETIVMLGFAISFLGGVYLVLGADAGARRISGIVITCGMLGLSTLMQMSALLAQWNVIEGVAVFVAPIAGCSVLVGGIVFYVRNRPQTFDDRTQDTPSGQYAAQTPAMPRRGRI